MRQPLLLDASSLTQDYIKEFVQRLKVFSPKIIIGYANVVNLVAQFIENNRISLAPPKGIVTSAEVLTLEMRERIERVFGCPVFNRYGSREAALIASECSEHRGLHINGESLYVEIIQNGKLAKPGEMGEVFITDLVNYGMPLIRYRIGDVAWASSINRCGCGRGLPMLENIQGRVTDFLVTKEGKIVSGVALATYMITNIKGIRQIQLVQEAKDYIKIKLATNPQFQETSRKILLNRLAEFLGEKMGHEIISVDSIPHEVSGKFRFSISNISPFS